MKFTSRQMLSAFFLVALLFPPLYATAKPEKSKSQSKKASKAQTSKLTPAMLRGQIIFRRGNDVWMLDPKTRLQRQIFKNPFWEGGREPFGQAITFSPDLSHVVFTHESQGDHTGNELFIMNLDRTGKKQLTDTKWLDYSLSPRFSPDGQQVVYTRRSGYRMGGPGYTGLEIRVVNADGSNDHRVMGDMNDMGQSHFDAYWSRDGKRLLFTHYLGNIDYDSEGNNKQELQTCALDGSDIRPFDGNYGNYLMPEVSPNGTIRAASELTHTAPGNQPALRLFTAQSRLMLELFSSTPYFIAKNPQWSSDSKTIVFDGEQIYLDVDKEGRLIHGSTRGIWIIDSEGKVLRRLATEASLVTWLY